MDFQRAALNRIAHISKSPSKEWPPIVFICDEYQELATVGVNEPSGDEKFFSLSRQAKCVPLVATQSISSLQSTLPGDTWRTLLQTFRTKIFLSLSDDFSAKIASELCGQEEKWRGASKNSGKAKRSTGRSITTTFLRPNRPTTATPQPYSHESTRLELTALSPATSAKT